MINNPEVIAEWDDSIQDCYHYILRAKEEFKRLLKNSSEINVHPKFNIKNELKDLIEESLSLADKIQDFQDDLEYYSQKSEDSE